MGDAVHDLVLVGVAYRGPAIGEEDHDVWPVAFVGAQRQGFAQGVVDSRAADGPQLLDEVTSARAVLLRGVHQLVEQRLDLGGEAQDFKTVVFVEVLDAKEQRLPGLFQLRAGHRAGGVEHEGDILGNHFGGFPFHAGRGEQKEKAVLLGRFIGQ